MRILLTNDDGVHAPGINVLKQTLEQYFDVYVCAPSVERSTTSHALTTHGELTYQQLSEKVFCVAGYPADTILFAFEKLFDFKPDLVISGINNGANLGQDTFYSGTVGAAREAAFYGIPSIAISLVTSKAYQGLDVEKVNFETAAKFAKNLVKSSVTELIPKYSVLNINVPNLPFERIKGVKSAHLGLQQYEKSIVEIRPGVFKLVGGNNGFNDDPNSDVSLINQHYITMSPINLFQQNCQNIENWEGFVNAHHREWSL